MNRYVTALALPLVLMGQAASAEVVKSDDDGFITRDIAVVEATPKQTWLALISPSRWWNDAHTWSADAGNMTLRPQAGGCFCEKIPEDPDPTKITLEGSVEHMRVIQAFPEKALRMRGGLGPLQSEPVSGVLTIALSETDDGGTQIVWEYVVGGYMRYEVPMISMAVDGVMTQQLQGLAKLLGPKAAVEPDEEEPSDANAGDADNTDADAGEAETSEDAAELDDAIESDALPSPDSVGDAIDAMARDTTDGEGR